jgi:G:T-mismatch repair DNA endonuclease (very short patch repair protein)
MSNSKLETVVAGWLDDHGVQYTREKNVWFRRVDFVLSDDTILQVHGCWVHGCLTCNRGKPLYPHQRKALRRDKAFRTYCRRNHRTLVELWECEMQRDGMMKLEAAIRR